MKLFYHACLLSILAIPAFAGQPEHLKATLKGKERFTISQQEEPMTSSEDEELGGGPKKVESTSESSDEGQEEWVSESDSDEGELSSIHASLSTSWTGEHLPFTLREPARKFYEVWHPLSAHLVGNPYANFINQVVEKDGIGVNSIDSEEAIIDYNFSLPSSSSKAAADWKMFLNEGKLLDAPQMLDNPFADYFKGILAYSGILWEESNLSAQQRYEKAAQLLNYASKNYYWRATSFMLDKNLGHVLRLDREELEMRKKMELGLPEVVIDYVNHLSYPRLKKIENIDTLELLIDLLPGPTEDYRTTYNQWVNELTYLLESSKKTSSNWAANLSTWTINSFAASVLLTSAGNSLSSWDINHMVAPAILGITQAASGITTVVVGGASTPWMRNLWSSLRFVDSEGKFHWWPTKVSLLKDSLTFNEIKDSVRLVILYGLLYNVEALQNGIDLNADRSKKYLRKLRDLILTCDYKPLEVFSSVVLKKESQEFKY
ncbi:hypothetical protein [Candidatus Odyssella acanthamoebae]|uniref:Uncharacterized protein n=1 Tax=Candidatus Odyssella acanthamoebae TaxID=91604 RepID=A0A077AT14_9PROT|nr:hypothetical protein [Candidatus Paracaedibacter acanthamoebae]AIK96347.1 hypothetical protein ID47_05765 [Candidatus Paracaedibacter acanthamoebae]